MYSNPTLQKLESASQTRVKMAVPVSGVAILMNVCALNALKEQRVEVCTMHTRFRNHVNSFNPRTYKQPHSPTVVQGEGVGLMEVPLGISLCYTILQIKSFTSSRKPVMCFTK